jgi:2-keto-4-pentenoate hydratase/2-oxohepta-3-ene-1,7-dioic acid hydratase in catechol pathway
LLAHAWQTADSGIARSSIAFDDIELLAPVPRPGKIVAVGVNYADHAREQAREPPDHPVLFAKLPSSVIGLGADVRWNPRLTEAVDLEAELAVVIGRRCRRVHASDALDYVAGYTCLNDITARDLQYSDKQFVRGKSLDTFCPMGPWLVTPDEVGDPQSLGIRSFVNGEKMQDASTVDMIFGVAQLISFCSQAFTLEPGDVIATGTPSGVGWFREPKRLLKDGDEIVVEIDRIGRLVNRCREEKP